MIPEIDLFHQLAAKTPEGFVAITCYMSFPAQTNVYTPHGEWCGCSGAVNELTLQADIRLIIKNRIDYDRR